MLPSVVDSIEKLGGPRIARGKRKERIMEPVTTAPLAMADCISSGCLFDNWQISGRV